MPLLFSVRLHEGASPHPKQGAMAMLHLRLCLSAPKARLSQLWTCIFIHYPVSVRHTIICVFEPVILFLITLVNKRQETMFAQRQDRRGGEVQSIFHTTRIHVLTFHLE